MILIVNDDGYDSDNLKLLYEYCKTIDNDVVFVVPLKDHSGVGNKSSLNKHFHIEEVDGGFIMDGTPVDCVRWGLSKFTPNLIITGVNIGFNVGSHTLLNSGTFMSAMEGYLHNIKSLACSFDKFKKLDYKLLHLVLNEVLKLDFELANLNIVSPFVIITDLCENMYDYVIENNTIKTYNKTKFIKNTDGDIVFNEKNSSLTIFK